MTLDSCLYAGQVFHRRLRPRKHELRYSVFSLLVDLAEIDHIDRSLWIFSHNRFNLFAIHDHDFGEQIEETLSGYICRKLTESGIHTMPTQILLSCYPRVLGYVFNPLSLFYCFDDSGECFAVVHEVHNTFGERHAYVLAVDRGRVKRQATAGADVTEAWIEQHVGKQLFVSPFAHMGMNYQFRLNVPGVRQVIVIRAMDEQGLLITASYAGVRHKLTNTALVKYFCKIPLLTFKVIAGIHWEALRLWVKGVPLYKHQPKRSN
ncbi:MAG: DUF1365 family protein [Granulosicoccus sp.]|nr:DUF1365 family protein [Granulosicoccus sp.]